MKTVSLLTALTLPALLIARAAGADSPVVEAVTLQPSGNGWTVSVTLSHGDTGWDDYADGWRLEAADGTVLGTRELLHPHVQEQPFKRSLSGVNLPDGTAEVWIRARTNTDGWAADRTRADLP